MVLTFLIFLAFAVGVYGVFHLSYGGFSMSNNLFDSYEFITGIYYNNRTSTYFKFLQTNESVKMIPLKDVG